MQDCHSWSNRLWFPPIVVLPRLPTSRPRWLLQKGKHEEARRVLHWLREDSYDDAAINREYEGIRQGIETYRKLGMNSLSLFKEKALFARLWRAALLQFMAQMCGATAMKYYLPTLLKALGLETRIALMAGAIEMTLKIGCTVIEMLIIDRLGRRLSLILGCAAMGFSMLVSSKPSCEIMPVVDVLLLGQRCTSSRLPR